MTNSPFNQRVGRWRFDPPTGSHTWTSRVAEWADRARVNIQWQAGAYGPAHQLTHTQTPIIDGILHPEYRGDGPTAQIAKNVACKRIADSGHC